MAYQGSPLWGMQSFFNESSSTNAWEDKQAALSSLQAIRGMSAQSLAQYVEANAAKRVTWPIYWKALRKGYAQSLSCSKLRSFYSY